MIFSFCKSFISLILISFWLLWRFLHNEQQGSTKIKLFYLIFFQDKIGLFSLLNILHIWGLWKQIDQSSLFCAEAHFCYHELLYNISHKNIFDIHSKDMRHQTQPFTKNGQWATNFGFNFYFYTILFYCGSKIIGHFVLGNV